MILFLHYLSKNAWRQLLPDQLSVFTKSISTSIKAEVLAGLSKPIKFIRIDSGGSQPITYGYEATKLIDLCDALMDLNKAGVLKEKQKIYAVQAEMIIWISPVLCRLVFIYSICKLGHGLMVNKVLSAGERIKAVATAGRSPEFAGYWLAGTQHLR